MEEIEKTSITAGSLAITSIGTRKGTPSFKIEIEELVVPKSKPYFAIERKNAVQRTLKRLI